MMLKETKGSGYKIVTFEIRDSQRESLKLVRLSIYRVLVRLFQAPMSLLQTLMGLFEGLHPKLVKINK